MFEKPKIDSYANALLAIAKETGNTEVYINQINELYSIIKHDQKFIQVMTNKEVSVSERKTLIENIFGSGKDFDQNIIYFLKVLIDNNAFFFIKEILIRFFELVDEMHGVDFVKVYSAFPLSEQEVQKLSDALVKKNNLKKVKIKNIIDRNLICGVKIVSKFFTIDNSLKSKIDLMLKKFTN